MKSQSLFFETIKVIDNKICNLEYHQQRLNFTQNSYYGKSFNLDLDSYIDIPDNKLYKCRVSYSTTIDSVELLEYSIKKPKSIQLVHSNIEYSLKYSNREEFKALKEKYTNSDEILIVKDNMLTDTTIANIALFKNGIWYTPNIPLLKGTTRSRLLSQKDIIETHITISDLEKYERIGIMNAMTDFIDLGKFTLLNNQIIIED